MDLLFCCVEREIANVERGRVLQLVLEIRARASLVIIAVPSALLLKISYCRGMHVCAGALLL